MTVFSRLIQDRRRGALWWAIGVALAVALILSLWPSVRDDHSIDRVVEHLPASLRALIGTQAAIPLSSAAGYLQARLFSTTLPILLLVYAIGLGAGAIGSAEESGTLQLVVTAPITRKRVSQGRVLRKRCGMSEDIAPAARLRAAEKARAKIAAIPSQPKTEL